MSQVQRWGEFMILHCVMVQYMRLGTREQVVFWRRGILLSLGILLSSVIGKSDEAGGRNIATAHSALLQRKLESIFGSPGGGNPDADLVGLVENLDVLIGCSVDVHVDEHALRASGVVLENLTLPMSIRFNQMSVRSALRVILDRSGLGFFVDDQSRIVITASRIAGQYYAVLQPDVDDLASTSLESRRNVTFVAAYTDLGERRSVRSCHPPMATPRAAGQFLQQSLPPTLTQTVAA